MMMTVLLMIVLCWDDVHGRCGNVNADLGDLVAQGLVGRTSVASPGDGDEFDPGDGNFGDYDDIVE